MSCEFNWTTESTLVSIGVTYSLSSDYSASAKFSDVECQIKEEYIYTPWVHYVSFNATSCSLSEEELECLTGDWYMVNGVIAAIQFDNESEIEANVTVTSYFSRLENKPINTEPFLAQGANTVLTSIAALYAGIPPELTDFNAIQKAVVGPVVGNNTLDEMRQVAQAGYSHLFVQVGGILTVEPWLGCDDFESSDIDDIQYIPCYLVKSASRKRQFEIPPTVIRVRGRNVNQYCGGEETFTDGRLDDVRGGYESIGGGMHKCVITGISQKDATTEYRNLAGNRLDLVNANLYTVGLLVTEKSEVKDGFVKGKVSKSSGWLGQGENDYYSAISGQRIPQDQDAPNNTKVGGSNNLPAARKLEYIHKRLTGSWSLGTAGPSFGKGVIGIGPWSYSESYTSDEPTRTQQEVVVADTGLVADFGIREEQIENRYAYSKEQLFHIAIRRFQQWRQEQSSWEVELGAPMPCLRLNQLVSFQTPATRDCPSETVTGVIAGIYGNYDSQGASDMRLELLGLDGLCETEYTSGNLLPEFCGTAYDNGSSEGWYGSGINPHTVGDFSNDAAILIADGTLGTAFAYRVQEDMEVGASYAFYFECYLISGGPPSSLSFTVKCGGVPVASSPVISGTGVHTILFSPTLPTTVFRFDVAVLGTSVEWVIRNMQLVKKVIA